MTLGPYEIVEKTGAGGMGAVYRARDTRLDRAVAIKVLPEEFAAHPKMRERQGREARAVSALSHPSGMLTRVEVNFSAATPIVNKPAAMFPVSSAFMLQLEEFRLPHYDVAPDGQRFLVRELVSGRHDDPVTLIVSTGPMTDAHREH